MAKKVAPTDDSADTIDAALRDLVDVETRLARLGTSNPWALEGARVLEGVRACLGTVMLWRPGDPEPTRAAVLRACSTRLLRHALGQGADSAHLGDERGRRAERLRDVLDRVLADGRRDPRLLAAVLDMQCRIIPGLMPDSPDRVTRWEQVIAEVLADPPRTQLAESLLFACARAVGVRKPSTWFDRERKAAERSR